MAITAMQPNDRLSPFRDALIKAQSHFRVVLPSTVAKFLTPERMTRVVLSAVAHNPILLQCTPTSILKCTMEAASLGLEPTGGVLGEAYMVPYRNGKTGQYEAQLIVGYRGLVTLARRSGNIHSVEAHVVYAKDHFELSFGLEPRLVHKPALLVDRGGIIAGYCVAHFSDGSRHCEVMTRAEIDDIRARSRSRDNGPWATDYSEMARKTVVRRAAKYWPMSIELRQGLVQALEIEDAAEGGEEVSPVFDAPDVIPATEPTRTKRIAERAKANLAKHDSAEPPPPGDEDAHPVEKTAEQVMDEREPGEDG